jgi:hypothetical protein
VVNMNKKALLFRAHMHLSLPCPSSILPRAKHLADCGLVAGRRQGRFYIKGFAELRPGDGQLGSNSTCLVSRISDKFVPARLCPGDAVYCFESSKVLDDVMHDYQPISRIRSRMSPL